MKAAKRILVIHGPNLNLLGEREPGIYGITTMEEINRKCIDWGEENNVQVECFQSNSEGAILDKMQQERKSVQGMVLNAGAYTHYSYALRDCIAAISVPVVEVHLSNPQAREEFRQKSVIAPVVVGSVSGLGPNGYVLALEGLKKIIEKK